MTSVTDLAPARQRFSRFADLLEGEEDSCRDLAVAQGRKRRPPHRLGKLSRSAGSPNAAPPYDRSSADRSRLMI